MTAVQHPMHAFNAESRLNFFFGSLLPGVPLFNYHSLRLLNPQSLPSNEASPGFQKTY